jgi:hypothetical protein
METTMRSIAWMIALCLVPSCKDDDAQSGDGGSSTGATDAGDTDSNAESNDTASSQDTSEGPSSETDPDASDTSQPDSSGGTDPDTGTPGEAIYEEAFDGADGSPWPSPWEIVGTSILEAELDGGRGRMSGQMGVTARMALPGFDVADVDIVVVVEFENWNQQGFGFYARQNGGALQQTDPPGQGYAVFIEGGFQQALGLWTEIDGVETAIVTTPDAVPGGVAANTPYVIRFQCLQNGATTTLRAKMWREDEAEPGAWMVETEDGTPQLQNIGGGFASDVYNYGGTGSVWVNHVTISEL